MNERSKTIREAFKALKIAAKELGFAFKRKIRQTWENIVRKFERKKEYYQIIKAKGEDMTIRTLAKYLEDLGFGLRWVGCENYVIINHKKKHTNWMIKGSGKNDLRIYELQEYIEKNMFGNDYRDQNRLS